MKKLHIILLGCLALASCIHDVDSIIPYFRSIEDDGFGGQITFEVYATGLWSCGTVSAIKGLTVTPETGNGTTMVTVTIPENTTGATTLSYLNFTCGSAKSPVAIFHNIPAMNLGKRSYTAVKLTDGNWWTSTNLGYIESSKTVSAPDFSTNTGIWFPCNPETGNADDTTAGIESKGYLYSPANLAGLCPEGWHLPTAAEWEGIIATSDLDALDKAGFNLAALGYVTNGNAYAYPGQASMYACSVMEGSRGQSTMVLKKDGSATVLSMGSCSYSDGISVRCVKDSPTE